MDRDEQELTSVRAVFVGMRLRFFTVLTVAEAAPLKIEERNILNQICNVELF